MSASRAVHLFPGGLRGPDRDGLHFPRSQLALLLVAQPVAHPLGGMMSDDPSRSFQVGHGGLLGGERRVSGRRGGAREHLRRLARAPGGVPRHSAGQGQGRYRARTRRAICRLRSARWSVPALHTVDRCVTCHLGIDDPRMADQRNPHRTHPKRLLAIHRVEKFGCTVCHQGQGAALNFEEAKAEDYFWDYPLLPAKLTEATCASLPRSARAARGLGRKARARHASSSNRRAAAAATSSTARADNWACRWTTWGSRPSISSCART